MLVRPAARAAVRSAFTLMEILAVVAIIVVLAGLGGYYLLPRVDEAKVSIAKSKITMLDQAVQNFNLNNGEFPATLEALIVQQPNGGVPLVEPKAILDPWNQPFGYDPTGARNNGLKPDIWAARPQGQIGNWPDGN